MESKDIFARAREYLAWDPCEETRQHVKCLLDATDEAGLSAILDARLTFGTAGLRGRMSAGYAGMNYLVVLQTTQGLIRYLQKELGHEVAADRGVIVGYDHRRMGTLHSKGFAEICARVFAASGFNVYLYEDIVATPLVPFGVNKLNTAAGIMITASHNPKQDNGYKLYWGNGVQIIPPHDAGIYESILDNLSPWQDYSSVAVPASKFDEGKQSLREHMTTSYFADQKKSILNGLDTFSHVSERKIAYTGKQAMISISA